VRPVLIVVDLVLAQDPLKMALIPDQGAVQEFAPTKTKLTARNRVFERDTLARHEITRP
jgi:hypothetical protein